ncbi:hypothetical protein [Acidithiobacillus acidisediminis]|jgi:hypothetical protein|nr:hypothetical protein [Acidithiobacillus sp. S30A2]
MPSKPTSLLWPSPAPPTRGQPDVLFLRALGEQGATPLQILPTAPEASSFAAEIFHKAILDQDL